MWEGEVLKALLLRHRFDSVSITELKPCQNVCNDLVEAMKALDGKKRERRQLKPHVRFQVHFWGRKVNWSDASHVRASVFQLYMLVA